MTKLILILTTLLFGTVLPAHAWMYTDEGTLPSKRGATKCEPVIVNGRQEYVCDLRQPKLKGADCWRIGPIQHCDYRPDPWDPWHRCRGWGCR